MGFKPDKASHTGDCLLSLYEYCIQMIKDGKAYPNDAEKETMQEQRWDGLTSARRDYSVKNNSALTEEVNVGNEGGQDGA